MLMENSNDTIGNRTRDLPACRSEKIIELVRERYEHYGLSNSQYSDNLRKERIWEEIEEEMKQTGSKRCSFFNSIGL
jgi:hypothetical protein